MRLCINCHALNADDTIFCSECGMSLINVPTGEEALELTKAWEAGHPEETGRSATTDRRSGKSTQIARFMWGWVLLGVGVPPTTILFLLLLHSESFFKELLSPLAMALLFVLIVDTGLGAWMVLSGAGAPTTAGNAPQTGRMAVLTYGWLSVALGVPLVVVFLLTRWLGLFVGGLLWLALLWAALDTGLAAGILWCASRLSSRLGHRTPLGEWPAALVLGLLTTFATAAVWLYSLALFFGLSWFGSVAPEAQPLGLLLLGSLFVAPLVGAVIVLVQWLQRRFRSSHIGAGPQ